MTAIPAIPIVIIKQESMLLSENLFETSCWLPANKVSRKAIKKLQVLDSLQAGQQSDKWLLQYGASRVEVRVTAAR